VDDHEMRGILVWYLNKIARMKVMAGMRLAMAEVNVADVKAMLSIYKF
jgi:hypothetical protein